MADATSAVATYYKHTFPADDVFRFATIHARDPSDVEVVVTFEGVGCGGGEIWKRFNACARAADLRALALGKTNPTLHMGAAYNEAANRARAPGVVPVGKPLLFDLDVQDLAWLKVDKNDLAANDRAVRLLFGAAHVLKVCLQEMFGFEHFLPIYSGRRGVHLWVLDQRAWSLSTEARRAICAALAAPGDGTDDDFGRFGGLARWPSVSEACWAAQQRVEDEVLFAPRSAGGFGLLDSKAEVDAFVARLFDVKQDATYAEHTTQLRGKTLLAVGMHQGAGSACETGGGPRARRLLPTPPRTDRLHAHVAEARRGRQCESYALCQAPIQFEGGDGTHLTSADTPAPRPHLPARIATARNVRPTGY